MRKVFYWGLLILIATASSFGNDSTRLIHAYVALCDNFHQGIIPVPEILGNGRDARNNLYWGARYGLKTYFSESPDWDMISCESDLDEKVLERCIFKYKKSDVYMIADAYAGEYIQGAIMKFLETAAGKVTDSFNVDGGRDRIVGKAELVAFIGHNGLMDFNLEELPITIDSIQRDVIILACASQAYFEDALRTAGAYPLIWTRSLMAPEAYTLLAAIEAWADKKTNDEIQIAAADAYSKYQKCSLKAARNLLATGW